MCKQFMGLSVSRGQLIGLVEMEKSLSNLPTKSFYIHNNFDHTNLCGGTQKKEEHRRNHAQAGTFLAPPAFSQANISYK